MHPKPIVNRKHGKSIEAAKTESRRPVQELNQAQEKNQAIVEHIGVSVTTISPDMRVLSMNRQMREWYPNVSPSAKPLCYESFNNPPAKEICTYCPAIRALRDEQSHEVVTETPSGDSVRNFRLIAIPATNPEGRVASVIVVVEDVTELKRSMEALRVSEQRYRSYIELTGQLGWTTNAAGELVEDLTAWWAFTGQSREETRGMGWIKALHPDDAGRALQAWKEAVAKKIAYEVDYRIRRYDGKYRHWLVRGVPLFEADGIIREWIGICMDITDRTRAEAALRATAEELETKTRELEEMNAALRVLLQQREEDKNDLEEKILASVKELVLPHMLELKKNLSGQKEMSHVLLMESGLQDIISPFAQKLSSRLLHLTQKEIQIASLIKEGKTTKDIAEFMDLSKFAIDNHRAHLRRKMGLTNRKVNLRTYLLSLSK